MAIATPTNLTANFSATNATSYTTASISTVTGRLYLLAFATKTEITADPTQPTASGTGLSFTVPTNGSVVYDSSSSSRRRVTLFRALGASPSTGALTIDFGGQAQTDVVWILDEATGVSAVIWFK